MVSVMPCQCRRPSALHTVLLRSVSKALHILQEGISVAMCFSAKAEAWTDKRCKGARDGTITIPWVHSRRNGARGTRMVNPMVLESTNVASSAPFFSISNTILYRECLRTLEAMAEGLAIVGLVSAIVQLTNFGTKIVKRLHEFQEEVNDCPKAFQDIQDRLPLIVELMREIKAQIDAGQVSCTSQEMMFPVIQRCLTQVEVLDNQLIKAMPRFDDSSWRRGKKAFFSVVRQAEVERIDSALKDNFNLLVQVRTMQSVTSQRRWDHQSSQRHAVQLTVASQHNTFVVETRSPKSPELRRVIDPEPVFMLSFSRDTKFQGRDEIIEALNHRFLSQRRVAIAGLGGVGSVKFHSSLCALVFCVYLNGVLAFVDHVREECLR